jgi:hypothetical protein
MMEDGWRPDKEEMSQSFHCTSLIFMFESNGTIKLGGEFFCKSGIVFLLCLFDLAAASKLRLLRPASSVSGGVGNPIYGWRFQ